MKKIQVNNELNIFVAGDTSGWNQEHHFKHDKKLLELIKQSDLFVFNLEGVICANNERKGIKGFPANKLAKLLLRQIGKEQPAVFSHPRYINNLKLARKNVACLANNHILDNGSEGVKQTINHLNSMNFSYLGAGINVEQSKTQEIIKIGDITIGLLNYNLVGWRMFNRFVDIFSSGRKRAGASKYKASIASEEIAKIAKETDLSIVIYHTGRAGKTTISSEEIDLFNKTMDLGANIVIGTHSHIRRGIYKRDEHHYSFFGLGDFIFDLQDGSEAEALAINIKMNKDGFKPSAVPLTLSKGKPRFSNNKRTLASLNALCEPFNTTVDNDLTINTNG